MDVPSNVTSSHGSLNKPGSSANMGSQINLMAEPSKASVEKVLDTARLTDRGWEASHHFQILFFYFLLFYPFHFYKKVHLKDKSRLGWYFQPI